MKQLYKVAIVQVMLGYALFSSESIQADCAATELLRSIEVGTSWQWPAIKEHSQAVSDSFLKIRDSFPAGSISRLRTPSLEGISFTLALEIKK